MTSSLRPGNPSPHHACSTNYFPTRIGDEIIWLRNFDNKIAGYAPTLGISADAISEVRNDVTRVIYLLDTVNDAARQFDQAVSAYIRLALDGPEGTSSTPLPTFSLPTAPPPPGEVAPGALKRLFRFIKNLKTRLAYTEVIGEDLGIIGEERGEPANAVPSAKAEVTGGEIRLIFKKMGHLGV